MVFIVLNVFNPYGAFLILDISSELLDYLIAHAQNMIVFSNTSLTIYQYSLE